MALEAQSQENTDFHILCKGKSLSWEPWSEYQNMAMEAIFRLYFIKENHCLESHGQNIKNMTLEAQSQDQMYAFPRSRLQYNENNWKPLKMLYCLKNINISYQIHGTVSKN